MVSEATLRDWINEHSVCWECSPMVEMYEGKRVQVGFELNLFGRHPAGGILASGGISEGHALYQKLKEIALFALPKEERPSRYEIEGYREAIYFRPASGSVPELQLTVRVLHRAAYFDPIDACETKCANEIQDRLRALGARPNAWTGRASPHELGKAG